MGGRFAVLARFTLHGLVCLGIYYVLPIVTGAATVEWRDFGAAIMITAGAGLLVELGALSSRVFGEEVRGRTLAMLLLIPRPTGYLAYSKVAGCLLGVLPACAWFAVGVLLGGDLFIRALAAVLQLPLGWYGMIRYLLLLNLIGYLSLFTGWRITPIVAIALYILDLFLFVLVSGLGRWESTAGPAVLALLGLPAIVLVQFCIASRLRAAAGE